MNHKKSAAVLSLTAILLAASASFGGPLEDASSALERKDYKQALSLLLPLAKEGNVRPIQRRRDVCKWPRNRKE
jgi:hypothetical protein